MFGLHRKLLDNPEFWNKMDYLESLDINDEVSLSICSRSLGWQTPEDVEYLEECVGWANGNTADFYVTARCVPAEARNINDEVWLSQHQNLEG